jgi:hypothetical protein
MRKEVNNMAGEDDLRAVAGKALADLDFRQKLLDDPEAAVKDAGFELSKDQMDQLKHMDKKAFEGGLEDLDQRLTMGCWTKGVQVDVRFW